jgi:hypothetical protein
MKILSILSCLIVFSLQRPSAIPVTPFTVAVLQSNGALIPFASYDGTKWFNAWPGPDEQSDAKIEGPGRIPSAWTGGVRLPESWRLWLSNDTSYYIKALGTAYVKNNCADHWSLTVDFPKQATGCGNCCPVPTIGIALSSDRVVMPMTETDVTAAVRTPLLAAFNQLENLEISRVSAQYGAPGGRLPYTGQPTDVAARNSSPLTIKAWRGSALNYGFESLYYIEAKREYAKPANFNDSGCPGVSAFRGWILEDTSGKTSVIDKNLVIEDCDMKTFASNIPMGLIAINGVTHAIVQTGGWEYQAYRILRIEANSVREIVTTSIH